MPWAAPPTRVYPAGTEAAGLEAVGLADAVALEAAPVADAPGFAVPDELLHDDTTSPIPITKGSAKPTTLMLTFARLSW